MSDSSGLDVGDRAPDFTAPVVFPDGTVEERPLSSFLESGPVLLAFYTNDFTPDCIEEWCAFRDFDWFTTSEALTVLGVSASRTATHKRFIDHLDLGFPLVSDRDLAVAERYDVAYRAFKLLPRARRSCFLVDTDRRLRYTWIAANRIDPTFATPDVEEIYEAIREVFGDEVFAPAAD